MTDEPILFQNAKIIVSIANPRSHHSVKVPVTAEPVMCAKYLTTPLSNMPFQQDACHHTKSHPISKKLLYKRPTDLAFYTAPPYVEPSLNM